LQELLLLQHFQPHLVSQQRVVDSFPNSHLLSPLRKGESNQQAYYLRTYKPLMGVAE
jgi:hypothetical protein